MIRREKDTLVEVDPGIHTRKDESIADIESQYLKAQEMKEKRLSSGSWIRDKWESFRGRGHIDLAKEVAGEDAKVVSLSERRRVFEADSKAAIDLIQDTVKKSEAEKNYLKNLGFYVNWKKKLKKEKKQLN